MDAVVTSVDKRAGATYCCCCGGVRGPDPEDLAPVLALHWPEFDPAADEADPGVGVRLLKME